MNVKLLVKYRTPKGVDAFFESHYLSPEHALKIAEDLESLQRAKELQFIDEHETTWTVKELQNLIAEIETEPHDIKVYFDGGYDLHSKEAGLGCLVYYSQNGSTFRIRKNALIEEIESNNEAEYAALHLAIKELKELGVQYMPVHFLGDSKVVIHQLSGEWPCLEETLSNWADRIEKELNQLGITPKYETISRKDNRKADHLASQALKHIDINSTKEVN
ncbi:reverse transcriptase-like protein [Gracilibacillus kekensis]|uniref:Ribonuclease HI n=1 Tax=Gracilibacillus kekensis TaxID=1027249 RepID=A0A1M7Q7L8_9BACI|nr:reverse transcriptase-like protein [Gracilibacillus kekensis]SHN26534.1 ribonuclease HI [Gracilibacillus kekensis]